MTTSKRPLRNSRNTGKLTVSNELVDFDATKRAIATAKSAEEVWAIRNKMAALVSYYKTERDPEKARKAAEAKLLAEARMGEMSKTLKSSRGARNDFVGGADKVVGKHGVLKSVGVSKQEASMFEQLDAMPKDKLIKAASEGLTARSLLRSKPQRMTADELAAAGRSRKAERYYTEDGGSKSRIKLISDENRSLKAENAKLKEEVFRLNSDLAAIQTGQIMQISRAALEQRRAIIAKQKTKREQRLAVETAPDEKTKEDYERQIQRLKTQVNTERAKAASITMQRDALKAFSRDDRKFLLVFTHPDGATDPVEKAKRERAFKLINSIPEADA